MRPEDRDLEIDCRHAQLFLWDCRLKIKHCEGCRENTAEHVFRQKGSDTKSSSLIWPPGHSDKAGYLKAFDKCSLQSGDTVKVLRSLPVYGSSDYSPEKYYGWANIWREEMNDLVGKTSVIKSKTAGSYLLNFGTGYCFPYFILKKVDKEIK